MIMINIPMKKQNVIVVAALLCFAECSTQAQFGGLGGAPQAGGPSLSGPMSKLFAENSAFSASMEMQTKDPKTAESVIMPGKIDFLDGKSRFELNMTQVKGARMSPEVAGQLSAMGMSEMIAISRPDKKVTYLVYPGLKSYAEQPMAAQEAVTPEAKFKMEVSEVGKEILDGHPCVKNKVMMTGDDGKKHEFTVCNASDLKKFPVKIDMMEDGNAATLTFKGVKFEKPEASLFDPPTDFRRYESVQTMMMQGMMKMMGK
jgi:hypothetical protein